MNITRLIDCPFIPWKNNGGVTQELYKKGNDPFSLRISVAKVSSSGPFSFFPEHYRDLILLKGQLKLTLSDRIEILHPLIPFSFSGNDPVEASLLTNEVQDFNVIYLKDLKTHIKILDFKEEIFEVQSGEFLFIFDGEVKFQGVNYSQTLFEGPGKVSCLKNVKGILVKVQK